MKTLITTLAAALISGAAWGQSDDMMALERQIEEMQKAICDKLDEQTEIMRAQLIYLKLQKKIDLKDPTEAVNYKIDNDVGPYDLQEASRIGHMAPMNRE